MSQRRIVEEVPAPVGLSSEIHLKRAVTPPRSARVRTSQLICHPLRSVGESQDSLMPGRVYGSGKGRKRVLRACRRGCAIIGISLSHWLYLLVRVRAGAEGFQPLPLGLLLRYTQLCRTQYPLNVKKPAVPQRAPNRFMAFE